MIAATGLTRAFDGNFAVEQVSFEVGAGQLFALLGPNGAGKTTTVRLLLGLIAPTAGSALVAGHRIGGGAGEAERVRLRASCGLLTEAPGFYDRLSGWDNLLFFGQLYRLQTPVLQERCERYLREFGLWDRRLDLLGTYSKGMKQKLAIVRALFHDPQVLFMDEPTSGLDPEAARDIRDLIQTLKQQGRTILLCTHNLTEAEKLADVVGILRRRLLVCAPLDALRRGGSSGAEVRVRVANPDAQLLPGLHTLPGVESAELRGATYIVRVSDVDAAVPDLIAWLVQRGSRVLEVTSGAANLESIYFHHINSATVE